MFPLFFSLPCLASHSIVFTFRSFGIALVQSLTLLTLFARVFLFRSLSLSFKSFYLFVFVSFLLFSLFFIDGYYGEDEVGKNTL